MVFPKWLIVLIVALVVVSCCLILAATAVGGWALFKYFETATGNFGTPLSDDANVTLKTLEDALVPANNPRDLARRLEGKGEIPETVDRPVPDYQAGERQSFWATNTDTNDSFQIDASLQYIGDHVYIWIENGMDFDRADLDRLGDTFDQKIYVTNREFFGSEWTPGIDGDSRLYIIYGGGLGWGIAGYFSSVDSVNPLAHEYSNAHEMFFINSDVVGLSEEFTYGVLAHEFQHMIHWYRDRDEETWLNEGFSELATFLNDLDPGGFDQWFVADPDLQLNDWPNDSDATTAHYGAGFMFVTYFLDRFGEDATKAVVADEENGLESIDIVLARMNETDPVTGTIVTADDVFSDWVLANYLMDPAIGDGRFDYSNYSNAPTTSDTESFDQCAVDWTQRTVRQYGTDYISLACDRPYTLEFQGDSQVGVIPQGAYSGDYAMWSNKGDESDMTITRSFDFTNVTAPITMTYMTWYDLEKDYDYTYVVVSEDGESWRILDTPSGTADDPSGNSFGWGYNGVSNGWIEEEVDLSEFAGKQVQVRFEYVTDAAVNGEGILVDDIAVPAIGYTTDFESDDGGWQTAGFVRIRNILPQTFRLSLIYKGTQTEVAQFTIEPGQTFTQQIDGAKYSHVILVVSGTTRYTRQDANYRFRAIP
ncbi:MAG: hypothetical protein HPY76_02405 [Anaerolineae bacterium]|nr:hypothetical protein [Anaerolineae bacterium]